MVSYSRHKPKKLSPLFSVLDWFRIFCSGCFGGIDHFKKPLPSGIPPAKLSVKSNSLLLDSYLRDGGENIRTSMGRFDSVDTPSLPDEDDGIVPVNGEDEDSDGMFHGHFVLGSKVLTEVELQSPVDENRVSATALRTPRRSANSSCASSARDLHDCDWPYVWDLGLRKSSDSSYASSTRELHLGSSQVCPLDSDSSSSLGASGIVSSRDVEGNPMIVPLTDEEHFTGPKSSNYATKDVTAATSRSLLSPRFHKPERVHGLTGSFSSSDLASPLPRDSGGHLAAEKTHNTHSKHDKEVIDQKLVQDGQEHMPVGSLPSCTTSNLVLGKKKKKNESKQLRARSLTDQDFTELKGCIDLGFVFPEDHVPDLCETLPALEVCYAVAHGAISPASNMEDSKSLSPSSPPISPWRIAGPGDQPQQVKVRLRQWAQAVACNVRHPV